MKKTLLAFFGSLIMIGASAQSDKYMAAMKANVAALDTIRSPQGWLNAANNFQRIAEVEKTQWLPYYYAALGNVMNGLSQAPSKMNDQLADKAEELLDKAEALEKENSEIYVIRKQIATLRMMVDPQTRYQQYGPAAAQALAKAKQMDPENPRVYLLEGQDKFYTPEQFGGSKSEAKKLFEESRKKFESFKPASEIHPTWGLPQVNYFISMSGN